MRTTARTTASVRGYAREVRGLSLEGKILAPGGEGCPDDGFSSGAFDGHLKLMFIRGTELQPEPPVTPVALGKSTRGVELASLDDLDERRAASWMKQAAAMPFFGAKKR